MAATAPPIYAKDKDIIPIIDAVDYGRFKNALTLTTKALKKQPTALNLLALKAYCMDRLGSENEAIALCQTVADAKPADDFTLQLLGNVYKAHFMHDRVVALYEPVVASQPKNEELANHLFMALVRTRNFKSTQTLAAKMQKLFKTPKYYFWTVTSLYLQAVAAAPEQRKLLLSLAERMMDKAKDEKKITSFEELQLYLTIYEAQNKYMDAAKLLSSPLGEVCKVELDRQKLSVRFLKLSEQHLTVTDLSRGLLEQNGDDWDACKDYLDCLLGLKEVDAVMFDEELPRCVQLIEQLQKDFSSKRGPFLLELQFKSRIGDGKNLQPIIEKYFSKFGSLAICFEDLLRYLCLISGGKVQPFLKSLEGFIETGDPLESLKRRINFSKIKYYFGFESTTDLDNFVSQMIAAYTNSIPLSKGLEPTERQYGDDFILLGALSLLSKFARSREVNILSEAISILEAGLKRSKYNFHMKLLLLKMYHTLGASQRIVDLAGSLDVKHILHDTISYIFADKLEHIAPFDLSLSIFLKGMTIYSSNEKETPEMLIQAFKFATFSKIPEFLEFYSSLKFSQQRATFARQIARVEIQRRFDNPSSLKDFFSSLDVSLLQSDDKALSSLVDNRDSTLNICWSKDGISAFELISGKESRAEKQEWLAVYGHVILLLRDIIVNEAADKSLEASAVTSQTAVKQPNNNTLLSCVTKLHQAMGTIKSGDYDDQSADIISLLKDNGTLSGHPGSLSTSMEQCFGRVELLVVVSMAIFAMRASMNRSDKRQQGITNLSAAIVAAGNDLKSQISTIFAELRSTSLSLPNNSRARELIDNQWEQDYLKKLRSSWEGCERQLLSVLKTLITLHSKKE
ncbi:N-acetyltransferase B complex non catalytic subunit-domain-containing protein [Zopfochytrium polystomum]|nr:N-acetyltransferase B complex non catalytic subunit-domain-containing protein [Zopfochytrium polystomum]